MNSNPQTSSRIEKEWVCSCQKYCNAEPRVVLERTFYRHLAEAQDEEQPKILALKAMTLEAARAVLVHRQSASHSQESNLVEPQPSAVLSGPASGLRRAETQRALRKRARETPDELSRVGRRKSARVNHVPASLLFPFSFSTSM